MPWGRKKLRLWLLAGITAIVLASVWLGKRFVVQRPKPQVMDDSRWASARDSTYRDLPFQVKDPGDPESCLWRTGCPYAPADLPPCPDGLETLTISELRERFATLRGSVVTVRGFTTAVGGAHTDAACACCNGYDGSLVLTETRLLAHPGPEHTRSWPPSYRKRLLIAAHRARLLLVAPNESAFKCSGDDTRLCCGFRDAASAVARGKLIGVSAHQLDVPTHGDDEPALEAPRLCGLP